MIRLASSIIEDTLKRTLTEQKCKYKKVEQIFIIFSGGLLLFSFQFQRLFVIIQTQNTKYFANTILTQPPIQHVNDSI